MKQKFYVILPLLLTNLSCNNNTTAPQMTKEVATAEQIKSHNIANIESIISNTSEISKAEYTGTVNGNAEPTPSPECLKTSDCVPYEYCQLKTQTCLRRCVRDEDCKDSDKPDGEACRSDGRCSPKVFETIIETTLPDQLVALPSYADHYGGSHTKYFQILWGDEPDTERLWDQNWIDATNDPPSDAKIITHRYAMPGHYHVRILGTYNGWGENVHTTEDPPILKAIDDSGVPRFPIVEVVSFGDVGLAPGAFQGTKLNKLPETDVPNANKLITLSSFFSGAKEFNQPIYWDTANVHSASGMFFYAIKYNQPLSFDTSNVITFDSMFYNAHCFNSSVDLDTSNARNMNGMFLSAESFNQPVQFDTANVIDMEDMFSGALAFNQPIHFDTGNVVTFVSMFEDAKAFNQPIRLDIGKAEKLDCMFRDATSLNNTIELVSTKPVTASVSSMLNGATSFKASLLMNAEMANNALLEKARADVETYNSSCPSFWNDVDYGYDEDGKYGAYEKASIRVLTPALRPRNQFTKHEAEYGRDGEYDENGDCQGEEGCKCGDGFCGYLGKCVEGVCQCGAYDRRRGIFVGKKSNDFYDFKCEVWQQADPGGKAAKVPAYHWVCDDTDGCSYRGWVYPYRAYFGDKTTPNGKEAFSDYEIARGVFDRVLSPEDAWRAKERGIDYDESVAADGRCSVRQVRHPGKGVFGEAQCRKITSEYRACEEPFCACGGSICAKGYMCDDTFECVCAREDGCGCNDRYILWGMGCKDGVPQCNGKPEPKPEGKHVCRALSDAGDDFGWAER